MTPIVQCRAECEAAGGEDDSTCADGFGVCCVSKYWVYTTYLETKQLIYSVRRDYTIFSTSYYISAKLTNGQTTSLNQSYIVQTSSDLSSTGGIDSTGRYEFTICPCNGDICRVRFDLTVSTKYGLEIRIK